jgi:hypothetical protein
MSRTPGLCLYGEDLPRGSSKKLKPRLLGIFRGSLFFDAGFSIYVFLLDLGFNEQTI